MGIILLGGWVQVAGIGAGIGNGGRIIGFRRGEGGNGRRGMWCWLLSRVAFLRFDFCLGGL